MSSLNIINDTAERLFKLIKYFHGSLTKDDEKSELLLCCVQDHRRLYLNCNKDTLKTNF